MLKHIVFLKADADFDKKELDTLFAQVKYLKKLLPGIMSLSHSDKLIQQNNDLIDQKFTHAYSMDFIDSDLFTQYLESTYYQEIKKRLKKLTDNSSENLLICNYEFEY